MTITREKKGKKKVIVSSTRYKRPIPPSFRVPPTTKLMKGMNAGFIVHLDEAKSFPKKRSQKEEEEEETYAVRPL